MSVLGTLASTERSAFDAHFERGCSICAGEIHLAAEIAIGLAPEMEPPGTLRTKVLDRITAGPTPGVVNPKPGITISRAAELGWRKLTRGIDVKTLHTDTDRRYRSVLLRFAPGAKLFKHRHPKVEEVFVVSGDVWIHGLRMSAGDYCRADADSIHEESYSENGCIVFISASMDNHPVS